MQAMRQAVRVGSTMLAPGKEGIVKPDAQGYYRVPVGAYNAYNSGGYLYDQQSGLSMFQPGSQLMRQLEKGILYGEYKHPERLPSMTDQQYVARIRRIDMDRVGHHIREYELVPSRDENGRAITLVLAHVKPYGPFGQYVEAALQNGGQNAYFSVRSITIDDFSRQIKYTKEIITHDFVGEGGIYVANKYNSPSLEDFDNSIEIRPETLHALAREQQRVRSLGLEDNSMDVQGLIRELGWERTRVNTRKPSFMKW